MEPIILASSSPQRQKIVENLHIPFVVVSPNSDEYFDETLPPEKAVEQIAKKKAEAVINIPMKNKPHWIIAADTLIFFENKPIGKPEHADHARHILTRYANTAHTVISSVACYDDITKKLTAKTSISTVSFAPLTADEIEWYISLGEWEGAAGGYRIQGAAASFISNINGSYSGIVGLPIYELYAILREHDYTF